MNQEVAARGGANQAGPLSLPFVEILLGLRQFHDVVGGILARDGLATAHQPRSAPAPVDCSPPSRGHADDTRRITRQGGRRMRPALVIYFIPPLAHHWRCPGFVSLRTANIG